MKIWISTQNFKVGRYLIQLLTHKPYIYLRKEVESAFLFQYSPCILFSSSFVKYGLIHRGYKWVRVFFVQVSLRRVLDGLNIKQMSK